MPSLKRNIIYNILYQVLSVVVPFVTSPYLARVLGAEQIGIYSYTYSIAFYFMILSMLGISNYGNRTIAKVRQNQDQLNQEFSSIYLIQMVCSTVMTLAYLVYVWFFARQYQAVAFLQVLQILSYAVDVSWFFYGLEEFRITVTRNTFVKLLTLILIFTLVKCSDDILIYTLIMAGSTLLGQLITWPYLIKRVRFVKPLKERVRAHMKPIIILFFPVLAVSIFSFMDKIMLGMFSSMRETAYYENSDKIISIPKALIQAFGAVMLPRTVHLLHNGEEEKSIAYIDQTMWVVLFITIGCAFGLAGVASTFAPVYWGDDFRQSGLIIATMTPALVFSGFGNVIRTQFLIPRAYDKEYTLSLSLGAVINVIINLLLIPFIGAVGAVIGTLFAEITLCAYQTWVTRQHLPIKSYLSGSIPFLMSGILMFGVLKLVSPILPETMLGLFVQVIIGGVIYLVMVGVYIMFSKNKTTVSIRQFILERLNRK